MGAFFTNLHIFCGDAVSNERYAEVIEMVRKTALSDGYVEAGFEDMNRNIIIPPPDSHPWITVYDELTESQDERILNHLGCHLSALSRYACVGTIVHDSDVLIMSLYINGEHRDRFVNIPDYFGDVPEDEKNAGFGEPERWAYVLAGGVSPARLLQAWKTEVVFAENLLAEIALLLDIDPLRCCQGYEDAFEEADDESEVLLFSSQESTGISASLQKINNTDHRD